MILFRSNAQLHWTNTIRNSGASQFYGDGVKSDDFSVSFDFYLMISIYIWGERLPADENPVYGKFQNPNYLNKFEISTKDQATYIVFWEFQNFAYEHVSKPLLELVTALPTCH